MRVLHTADWHLGHRLYGLPREHEHQRFFDWLLHTLVAEQIDALLVCGDVFDTANPSAESQRQYYCFLRVALERRPELDVVVIAGNHDSPSRLDAPRELLAALGPRVVGSLPRAADGTLDLARLLVELRDADGQPAALCLALPYLRASDLPAASDQTEEVDPLIEGARALHAELVQAAERHRRPGQAILATGHCYMAGAALSELSERRIFGGNLHALPVDVFPESVDYVALGHLHKAQRVGGRERVRYAGSPLPLSFAEADYHHQLRLVELQGGAVTEQRAIEVPRSVDLLRLGPLPLGELDGALAALPERDEAVGERWRPYLEVRVRLEAPEPSLRARVERALSDRQPRLTRLMVERHGDGATMGEAGLGTDLGEIDPDAVLRLRWSKQHEGEPPEPVLAAYHELLERLQRGER